jgi:hypothetical protein
MGLLGLRHTRYRWRPGIFACYDSRFAGDCVGNALFPASAWRGVPRRITKRCLAYCSANAVPSIHHQCRPFDRGRRHRMADTCTLKRCRQHGHCLCTRILRLPGSESGIFPCAWGGLPLLPLRMLREQRHAQIALLLLGIAIASAAALDHWSYSGSEWQYFWELNAARAPFTDFGVGEYLKLRPEIMARHGYSQNDVGLIAGWFFVDPQIADPKSLKAMLAGLGRLPMQESRVQSGWAAIQTLTAPALLPLLLPAVVFFVMAPRWSVALAWILCLGALFTMGAMGRPGVLRVYVPLVSLLLVAPLMVGGRREGAEQWMTVLMLLLACVGNASLLLPEAWNSERVVRLVQADIKTLPSEPIVSWGDAFPFEFSFPVLSTDPNSRDILLYSLGGFTHAPFSLSSAEQRAGRGMIERLRTPEGVPIIASQQSIELLRMYCRERLNAQFRESAMHQAPLVSVQRVWCESDE